MIYHLLILVAKILIYFKFSSFLVTFANYFRGVSIRAPYYTSLIVKKLKRRGEKPKNTGENAYLCTTNGEERAFGSTK